MCTAQTFSEWSGSQNHSILLCCGTAESLSLIQDVIKQRDKSETAAVLNISLAKSRLLGQDYLLNNIVYYICNI